LPGFCQDAPVKKKRRTVAAQTIVTPVTVPAAVPAPDLWRFRFLLIALTFLVYAQTISFEFVGYDDDQNIYLNPLNSQGLTWKGFVTACTQTNSSNWIPLTTLSHQLDCQIYGLWAGGHHLTNFLLELTAVMLLFQWLWTLTRKVWRSLIVTILFVIHPQHVESVAWVSERKDVLSGVFFFLTLLSYTHAVRKPKLKLAGTAFLLFLGLMAKPMLVTVPFLLVLLDYWPLGRLQLPEIGSSKPSWIQFLRDLWGKISEKWPLFLASVISSVVTFMAQQSSGAMVYAERIALGDRVLNAFAAYAIYLARVFFPINLAPLYPHPGSNLPKEIVFFSLALLGSISYAAWQRRGTRPHFLVFWCWYLGMMVPVIGIIQVGEQSMADRYTYLPMIGFYVMLTWLCFDWAQKSQTRKITAMVGGGVFGVFLFLLAFVQCNLWRSSDLLWTTTLERTQNNSIANNNYGSFLVNQGRDQDGLSHFEKAIEINPLYSHAWFNRGVVLQKGGNLKEALHCYEKAAEINSRLQIAWYNMGLTQYMLGNKAKAEECYRKTLAIEPEYTDALNNLGLLLMDQGRLDESAEQFVKALKINPNHPNALFNLGQIRLAQNRSQEAAALFQNAIRLNFLSPEIFYELGMALLNQNQIEAAIKSLDQALDLKPDYIIARNTIAAALLQSGKPGAAIQHYEKALESVPNDSIILSNLAWALLTATPENLRDTKRALALTRRAVALAREPIAEVLRSHARALAENGLRDEAIKTARQALQIAQGRNESLANLLISDVQDYSNPAKIKK
jgi:tetratricopeptide (TPR) repeat protein